jgi:hypothetical protein
MVVKYMHQLITSIVAQKVYVQKQVVPRIIIKAKFVIPQKIWSVHLVNAVVVVLALKKTVEELV